MTQPPEFSADFTETTASTRLAYDGSLLKVRRDEVLLHDGKTAWREYVEHPGAVMILAFAFIESLVIFSLLIFFLLSNKLPSTDAVMKAITPTSASSATP